MRTTLLVLTMMLTALPASAERLHLLEASEVASLLPDAVRSASLGQGPIVEVRTNYFLIGLSLVGAGVVLGGAGFAVLYACREGTECHSNQTLQIVGWCLAAPGIIPLAVGLLMIYSTTGGGSHGIRAVDNSGSIASPGRWVFSGGPIPGGMTVGAATSF